MVATIVTGNTNGERNIFALYTMEFSEIEMIRDFLDGCALHTGHAWRSQLTGLLANHSAILSAYASRVHSASGSGDPR